MFENLIESQDKTKKSIGQTITSFLVHAAVIAAAVKVTAAGAEAVKNVVTDTTMVFLKPTVIRDEKALQRISEREDRNLGRPSRRTR